MPELYSFISPLIRSFESFGGGAIVFGMFVILPALFGLLVTFGDRRAVGKAFLVWYGGLTALFFLMSGNFNDTMHGSLMYGMFFSIIGVPALSLAIKIGTYVKNRFGSQPPTGQAT